MKRILFSFFVALLCLVANQEKAFAQRTSSGTTFIGASQMVSAYVIPSGGLELKAGQYLLNAYWEVYVNAVDWMQKTDMQDVTLDRMHVTAGGGWMQRIASSYSRSFNLYAGGSAFLGYSFHEVFAKLPEEITSGLPGGDFIYGVRPAIEMEGFISRRVALTLGVQAPVTFSSSFRSDIFHVTGSLGLRINL